MLSQILHLAHWYLCLQLVSLSHTQMLFLLICNEILDNFKQVSIINWAGHRSTALHMKSCMQVMMVTVLRKDDDFVFANIGIPTIELCKLCRFRTRINHWLCLVKESVPSQQKRRDCWGVLLSLRSLSPILRRQALTLTWSLLLPYIIHCYHSAYAHACCLHDILLRGSHSTSDCKIILACQNKKGSWSAAVFQRHTMHTMISCLLSDSYMSR